MNPHKAELLAKLVAGQFEDLVNTNAEGIVSSIAVAEDGKLTVSLSAKLTLVNDRLFSKATITFGLRRKEATDDSIRWDDPNQGKLEMEVRSE